MDPLWNSFGSHPLTSEDADHVADVPKPLDCLQGAMIPPPFLSKTFDMVDDRRLDQIISWGESGASFIVWDPVEFARRILPKNFKHNNFSSFVRQLNTYGFRKIDTDRWEFACESFHRGKRHLLKNIRRRRSSLPSQQLNEESNSLSVEAEVDRLQKEKIEMMQEVIDLQHQQHGTHEYIEAVNQKLQAAEERQKQMVSSLAKVFQIQKFKKDQCRLSSRQTVRKFIKHQPHDPDIETETVPLQLHDLDVQEVARIKDSFPNEELIVDLDCVGTTMIKQDDIWRSEFETFSAVPNKMWNDAGDYEYPEFGAPSGEFSDFWDLADSGGEYWMSGETSRCSKTNQYGF